MELKPGYKQTEAGVIPEDWDVISIGKACRLINGRGFKPHEWENSGLPIIRIQNLNGSNEYNCFSGDYDSKIEVREGQLLFAWSGSRGTSFGPHIWQGPKALLNYHTWKVAINEKVIEPDYFYYALKKLTAFIEDKAHGASALVHTQKWEMEKFPIVVPTCAVEQNNIANALSNCEKLLSDLEVLLRKKRNIKQAAMQELLTGKRRLPGFEGEWEVKRLGEVAPLQRGFDLPNPQLRPGHYPVVYSNGVLNYHASFQVKGPGIITGRSGTIGKVHFVECDYWPHNTSLWVTDFKRNNPRFIFYLLTQLSLERFATGSGVPTLNRNDVHDYRIQITCDADEQCAIATALSEIDAEIAALEARKDKASDLKQGMLQQLLTGKVRLK